MLTYLEQENKRHREVGKTCNRSWTHLIISPGKVDRTEMLRSIATEMLYLSFLSQPIWQLLFALDLSWALFVQRMQRMEPPEQLSLQLPLAVFSPPTTIMVKKMLHFRTRHQHINTHTHTFFDWLEHT